MRDKNENIQNYKSEYQAQANEEGKDVRKVVDDRACKKIINVRSIHTLCYLNFSAPCSLNARHDKW